MYVQQIRHVLPSSTECTAAGTDPSDLERVMGETVGALVKASIVALLLGFIYMCDTRYTQLGRAHAPRPWARARTTQALGPHRPKHRLSCPTFVTFVLSVVRALLGFFAIHFPPEA